MPFNIEENDKYACIALENVGTLPELDNPMDLGDGRWALFSRPFAFDEVWQKWLGSIQAERLEKSNLLLFAVLPSKTPRILDEENENLRQIALSLFYALFLHDVFYFDGAVMFTGANVEGKIDIRSVSTLEPFYRPPGAKSARIGKVWLQESAGLASGIQSVHHGMGKFIRLRHSFHALLQGWMEFSGEDKLHEFIRAVDALVKAQPGSGRRLFVHRCQLFAGNNVTSQALLGELYDLRSAAEHTNPFQVVLGNYSPKDVDFFATLRSYQSLVLANTVYKRIFGNVHLQAIFADDVQIDAFWNQLWADQVRLWGKTIDLDAIGRAKFNRGRFEQMI